MKIVYRLLKNKKKNINKLAISGEKKLTYSDFWKLVINLANFIKEKKFKKICIFESTEFDYICYISMFASLISGATYIPVNCLTPNTRLKSILKISAADILISKHSIKLNYDIKRLTEKKVLNLKKKNSFIPLKSNRDAYIIFTSGSTGEPKGVRISRSSLNNYISYITKNFFNDKIIRCSQHASIGFDLSVADIYGTICGNGTLYPIRGDYNKLFLNKFIKKFNLTHWISVPSTIDIITNSKFCKKNDLRSLKKMFFCGEILKKIHLEKIFKKNGAVKIINAYGPTEATVSCTDIKLNKENFENYCNPTAAIGKPIKGVKFSINKVKNKSNYGEIIIEGPQVSNGYLNNNNLNKKKFEFKGNKKKFYTGDYCKLINGQYYFVTRKDNQVKIKGNRIELEEINNLVEKITKNTAYTIVSENKIITFISSNINEKKLISKLSLYIPNYMLPNKFLIIKNWPKSKNLKIDEKKLLKNYIVNEKRNFKNNPKNF